MDVKEQLLQEVTERDGSTGILAINILRNWSAEKMVKLRNFLVDRTPAPPPEAAGRPVPKGILETATSIADRTDGRNAWLAEDVIEMAKFVVSLGPEAAGRGDGPEVLREALRLACADAWPNQPQWEALYIKRAKRSAPPSGEQSQPVSNTFTSWDYPPKDAPEGCVGVRHLADGRTEYLMSAGHSIAPYYLAYSSREQSAISENGRSSDFNNEEKLQSCQQGKASELARTDSIQRDKSELVEFTNLLLEKLKWIAPEWTANVWKSRPANCRGLIEVMFPDYVIRTPAFEPRTDAVGEDEDALVAEENAEVEEFKRDMLGYPEVAPGPQEGREP